MRNASVPVGLTNLVPEFNQSERHNNEGGGTYSKVLSSNVFKKTPSNITSNRLLDRGRGQLGRNALHRSIETSSKGTFA